MTNEDKIAELKTLQLDANGVYMALVEAFPLVSGDSGEKLRGIKNAMMAGADHVYAACSALSVTWRAVRKEDADYIKALRAFLKPLTKQGANEQLPG